MAMGSFPPIPATRCGTGRLTALAVVVGLGMLGAMKPVRAPAHASRLDASTVTRCPPALKAADLVGIYRAGACTLTVDASGTYRDSCGDGDRHPYAIQGDELVLLGGVASRRPLMVFGGRLVDAAGTTYTITGGVR